MRPCQVPLPLQVLRTWPLRLRWTKAPWLFATAGLSLVISIFNISCALLREPKIAPSVPLLSDNSMAICPYIPLSVLRSLSPGSFIPNHLLLQSSLNSSAIRWDFIDMKLFALPTNMRSRQSTNISLDEYEPTDAETDHYSSSETELTDVDDDIEKVNISNDIEDIEEPKEKLAAHTSWWSPLT